MKLAIGEPTKPGYTPWLTNGKGEIIWKKDKTHNFINFTPKETKAAPKPLSFMENLKFELTF